MFKRIVAKNFLSWKSLDFPIKSGVTLIEGYNWDDETPEGSGKSAILNALCWGLFGRIPKEAKIDDVVRKGEKSCEVIVYLQKSVCVIRTRHPNDLYMQMGVEKFRGKDSKETQKKIEEYIGLSFETFCQSVYFAQNYPNKFITANENARVKILSDILDLGVFDKARVRAQSKIRDLETDWGRLKGKLDYYPSAIESVQDKRVELDSLISDKIVKQNRALQVLSEELEELKKEKNRLAKITSKNSVKQLDAQGAKLKVPYSKICEEIGTLKKELSNSRQAQLKTRRIEDSIENKKLRIKRLKHQLQEYQNPKANKCPTCGTILKESSSKLFQKDISRISQDTQEIKEELVELKRDLTASRQVSSENIKSALQDAESEKERLIIKLRDVERRIEEIRDVESDQCEVVSDIKHVNKRIHDLEEEDVTLDLCRLVKAEKSKLKTLKQERDKLKSEEEKLRVGMERLRSLREGFKEVKSYVFKGVLAELSQKSNFYLSHLFEVPIQLVFHNDGDSGDISKICVEVCLDGTPRPFGLYSGGQARRITLAVDLALSDLVAARGDKPLDVRFLDEVMHDLSEESMEKVLRLLERLQGSTILIEHNSLFKNIVRNTLKVEFKKGISTCKTYQALS